MAKTAISNWSIPQRYLRMTLYGGRKELKDTKILSQLTENFKISFNTSATVTDSLSECTVEIFGLKKDTMLYLSTNYVNFTKNPIQSDIVIEGGYYNNHNVVFSGSVIEAVPNLDSADYSVRLRCQSGYFSQNNTITSGTYVGEVSLTDILQDIANQQNLKLINNLDEPIYISDYSYKDRNFTEVIRDLSLITHTFIWQQENRLYALNQGQSLKNTQTFKIDSSNMIASPVPDAQGCTVRIRMNPSVQTGQKVMIDSVKFPQLKTIDYSLMQYSHSGDTKGNKWQTELRVVRGDIYNE